VWVCGCVGGGMVVANDVVSAAREFAIGCAIHE